MRCPQCGRWCRTHQIVPVQGLRPEGRIALCSCLFAGQQEPLLRLLSLLARCGVDPMAPPVLQSQSLS